MNMHFKIAARCNFSRLPLLAFLIEVNEDYRNFVKENSKYIAAVYTSDKQFVSALSRPYSSFEELKIILDIRWPSNFIDKINSQAILEPCSRIIVSMNQIKGIPQNDLLEYCNKKLL